MLIVASFGMWARDARHLWYQAQVMKYRLLRWLVLTLITVATTIKLQHHGIRMRHALADVQAVGPRPQPHALKVCGRERIINGGSGRWWWQRQFKVDQVIGIDIRWQRQEA